MGVGGLGGWVIQGGKSHGQARAQDVPGLLEAPSRRNFDRRPPLIPIPSPPYPKKPPVLGAQASNLTGFFEHALAPGSALEHYSYSMHDLPVRAEALLAEWHADPSRLWRTAGARASARGALRRRRRRRRRRLWDVHCRSPYDPRALPLYAPAPGPPPPPPLAPPPHPCPHRNQIPIP
jgi:hypothetical protein